MKVCLVSSPTVTEFNERQMAESEALRLIAEHAPVGILSLAAVLVERGITPHIFELNRLYYDFLATDATCRGVNGFVSYVVDKLLAEPFDVFGFSTICSTYPLTLRLAQGVKSRNPGATVIMGGPQASVVDAATLRAFPYVDYILRGEAEFTLPMLLEAVGRGGEGLSQVGGLTYRKFGEVVRNANAPVIEDLDSLPLPAFELFPYIDKNSYAALEAGRGCPFACSFCSTNDFFRRNFRMKSPSVLVAQMLKLKRRYGMEYFELIHDMFTVDRRKVLAFCDAVEAAGEKLLWSCSARTDCFDEELIFRMARSGCAGVFVGIDSGSPRIQEIIKKRLDIPEALQRVRQACVQGMKTTVSLITGFPEETKDDLRATVNFLAESLRHRRADLQLHLLAPLAETPLTTRYQDELIYDEIFSDMSFQGWEQSPEDRAMIVAHRDIFPNFYAVPTYSLDRYYLKELRDFLLKGAVRLRWLLLLLHRDSGDLLSVFDAWREWSPAGDGATPRDARTRVYYANTSFPRDLIDFTRSRYMELMAKHPRLVSALAEIESNSLSLYEDVPADGRPCARGAAKKTGTFGVDAVPVMADSVRVLHVEADYKRLLRCLQRNERLDRVPTGSFTHVLLKSGEEVRVLLLNEVSYELLRSCDGSRNMLEVARGFSAAEEIAGVPAVKVGIHGLALLAQQGLIELGHAAV